MTHSLTEIVDIDDFDITYMDLANVILDGFSAVLITKAGCAIDLGLRPKVEWRIVDCRIIAGCHDKITFKMKRTTATTGTDNYEYHTFSVSPTEPLRHHFIFQFTDTELDGGFWRQKVVNMGLGALTPRLSGMTDYFAAPVERKSALSRAWDRLLALFGDNGYAEAIEHYKAVRYGHRRYNHEISTLRLAMISKQQVLDFIALSDKPTRNNSGVAA